ncbi:MAG: class I SAM-dependent methyltransferase [Fuerstiella sp.]
MLSRVLEPEVMDTADEAVDYDAMDHREVNRRFVDDLLLRWKHADLCRSVAGISVTDLGTGTALIPLEIFQREPTIGKLIACDLSMEMLKIADQHIQNVGADCIQTLFCDCKQLPIANHSQDMVISNSIVHHIPEPESVLREAIRVLKPGGLLFVRDLMRPEANRQVEHFVQTYAGNDNADQQQLFRQSLHASLTVKEVENMLAKFNVPAQCVAASSDRHWTICYHSPLV